MNYEFLTGRSNDKLTNIDNIQIHLDLIPSLLQMKQAALEEADIDLRILSGFRSYETQARIWNTKASRKRPLLDENERPLDLLKASDEDILMAIVKWSAIPGASRHHWGSDFDIYDHNIKPASEVSLTDKECLNDFKNLYTWLEGYLERENCKFFRPYDRDRGGVGEEKWHLSFYPLSQKLFEQYSFEVFLKNIEDSEILFKEKILQKPDFFFETYVRNINLPSKR